MADNILRELLRNEPNPVEKLASDQQQLKIHSGWFGELEQRTADFLKTGKRIVVLECGHYVLSKSLHRAACPRCGEMIRSGYDYDGFRRLGMPDEFHWPEDPLLVVNEGERRDGHGTITRRTVI
ncbi:TPA: hypothetical protein VDB83_005855 [Burkholderia cenocepacia]|nr:hypothetical protein [Burkholderia cenocepacia]